MSLIYAKPNTDSWVSTEIVYPQLSKDGYIEMPTTPPELTVQELEDGLTYIADESGQWVLKKNPLFKSTLDMLIKRLYKVDRVHPDLYIKLANTLLEYAKNA